MGIIAVAGGSGDLGRLIVDAILTDGGYEVYVLSRKSSDGKSTRLSPVKGQHYDPIIQTDYQSEQALADDLTKFNVDTVVSAVSLDFDEASEAQLQLIRAAARTTCVKRFIPSEFNIDYDLDDNILPYKDKKYHAVARRELEKTKLEYTFVYSGFFMDYLGMPFYKTHMRQLYILLDAANRAASIPGDGTAKVAMTCTKDVARYLAAALSMEKWPTALTIVASQLSINDLVALAEQTCGQKLQVKHDTVEDLLSYKTSILPSNIPIAEHFPEGMAQLEVLLAELGAGIALGAYDLSNIADSVDLIKEFQGKLEPPTRIEDFIASTWSGV